MNKRIMLCIVLVLFAAMCLESATTYSSLPPESGEKPPLKPDAPWWLNKAATAALEIPDASESGDALLTIAALQVDAGNMEGARNAYSGAVTAAKKIEYDYVRQYTLRDIALSQSSKKLFADAALTASKIEEDYREGVLRDIAGAMAQAQQFKDAFALLNRISSPLLKDRTLGAIVKAQAAAGKFDEALANAADIDRPKERAEALCDITDEQIKAGKIEDAAKTLAEASKAANQIKSGVYCHDIAPFIRIANINLSIGNVNDAAKAYSSAMDKSSPLSNETDRKSAYYAVAKAQVNSIEILLKGDRITEAKSLLKSMEPGSLKAEALFYITEAHVKKGQLEDALATAGEIGNQNAWRKTSAFRLIVEAAQKNSNTQLVKEAATAAWQSIKEYEYENEKRSFIGSIAVLQAKAGLITGAIAMAKNAGEKDRDSVLRWVADALAESGKFDESMKVTEAIDDKDTVDVIFIAIARELAKAGKYAEALETLEKIENPLRKSHALLAVAEEQAKSGKEEDAKKTFAGALAVAGNDGRLLEHIAIVQAKAGYRDDAVKTFAAAVEATKALKIEKGAVPKADMLYSIARAQREAGCMDDAARTLADAASAADEIEEANEKAEVLWEIADAQSKAGNADEAAKIFSQAASAAKKMDDGRKRSKFLLDIARGQAKMGKFAEAMDTANEIKYGPATFKLTGLLSVIKAMHAAGKSNDAIKLLAKVHAAACDLENDIAKAALLSNIAVVEAESGRVREALKAFSEAWDAIKVAPDRIVIVTAGVRGDNMRRIANTQGHIAEKNALAGRFADAIAFAKGIQYDSYTTTALEAVAWHALKAGALEVLFEVTKRESGYTRAWSHIGVAKAILFPERHDKIFFPPESYLPRGSAIRLLKPPQ